MITFDRDLNEVKLLRSLLFPGVASERVHEAESPQILTQDDALLHGEDAAETEGRRERKKGQMYHFKNMQI